MADPWIPNAQLAIHPRYRQSAPGDRIDHRAPEFANERPTMVPATLVHARISFEVFDDER
jgi:hypothetical protein